MKSIFYGCINLEEVDFFQLVPDSEFKGIDASSLLNNDVNSGLPLYGAHISACRLDE